MPSSHRTGFVALLLSVALAAPAAAQQANPTMPSPPGSEDWTHGTTLSLAGGVASGSSDVGPIAGAAIGWEITPRLLIEGSGLWLNREGGDAFNAAVKLRAGVKGSGVSPFAEAGFGVYHVTTVASPQQTTNDPVFHVGAGVTFFLSRHIALQPAAEALIVAADAGSYTVGAFSLRFSYHFEDHPMTLSR
jgi:hypothetical protein